SFLGRMPPEAVLTAADDADARKKKIQVCDANFYGGELALRLSAKDEAERLFRLAASGCAKDANEWVAANAELKAPGAAPWTCQAATPSAPRARGRSDLGNKNRVRHDGD